jgi:predicted DNA-binding WGR domain protein
MSGVTLHRTDPARNMWRYYRLDIQRDLFGAWCFIREWGRDGQAGQTRTVP